MKRRVQVLVIGGGPVGACATRALAAAGARPMLLERESAICPPVGGAYANCGLVVPSDVTPLAAPGALGQGLRWLLDSSSPFYVAPQPRLHLLRWLSLFRAACAPARAHAGGHVLRELHVSSAALHAQLGESCGAAWLYQRNGVLQAYETEAGLSGALDDLAVARRLGVAAEVLSGQEVGARFPTLTGRIAGGVLYTEDGHLEPAAFTRAMAMMAADLGADVVTGGEAVRLDASARGPVQVLTTRGAIEAEQVVVAAGAWSPGLVRSLGLSLPIEPAKGYSVDLDRPDAFPDVPFYMGEARVVMTPLGDSLRLGSTLELAGWDTRVRLRRVDWLRRSAARAFGLDERGPFRQLWRGPRPVTPDGLPIVGRALRSSRVILATGHCMLGLTLAPVTGQLVAELAGGTGPSLDITPLSPVRFARF